MSNKAIPSFERVLADNKDKIYRICRIYSVSPIEPEDLFQEVTYHIWKAFASFENRSNINTWVYRIALNVCMSYKKKLGRRNETMIRLESIQFKATATYPDESKQEKFNALFGCMRELNEMDQSIVILSLDELPYREMAHITGLTENHIAVRMKRIRSKLLNCINAKLK